MPALFAASKGKDGLYHGCLHHDQQIPVPPFQTAVCTIASKRSWWLARLAMDYGHTAESSYARPAPFRDASDDLISPHPLDPPEDVDSSDVSGLSSDSRTSRDDGSLGVKTANAIFRLPPEVLER